MMMPPSLFFSPPSQICVLRCFSPEGGITGRGCSTKDKVRQIKNHICHTSQPRVVTPLGLEPLAYSDMDLSVSWFMGTHFHSENSILPDFSIPGYFLYQSLFLKRDWRRSRVHGPLRPKWAASHLANPAWLWNFLEVRIKKGLRAV